MRIKQSLHFARESKHSLKKRLFSYMLLLAMLLCVMVLLGIFGIGQMNNPKKEISQTLELQMEFFESSMESYWNQLAMMGIELSKDAADVLNGFCEESGFSLQDISKTGETAEQLQSRLLDCLCSRMRQTDCSGGFVMLCTPEEAETVESCSGIYVIKGISNAPSKDFLLYRGIASVGKEQNVMPHRKWRMTIATDMIPDLKMLLADAKFPLEGAYSITEMINLPGTDEQVYLLTLPIMSADGTICGLCGFEISCRYFRNNLTPPTKLSHLVCLLSADDREILNSDTALDCGVGYIEPKGFFVTQTDSSGLTKLSGSSDYIGMQKSISVSGENPDFLMTVMIPKSDYDRAILKEALRFGGLVLMFGFIAAVCCMYFSKKFIAPIISSLDHIKNEEYAAAKVDISELDDFSDFIQEKEKAHQTEIDELEIKKQTAENQAARIAYSRKTEIDPEIYESFKKGMEELTPTENKILQLYIDGNSSKEIIEKLGIKDSTLRFHNKNIYGKLGVNSYKQAVLYAIVVKKITMILRKSVYKKRYSLF